MCVWFEQRCEGKHWNEVCGLSKTTRFTRRRAFVCRKDPFFGRSYTLKIKPDVVWCQSHTSRRLICMICTSGLVNRGYLRIYCLEGPSSMESQVRDSSLFVYVMYRQFQCNRIKTRCIVNGCSIWVICFISGNCKLGRYFWATIAGFKKKTTKSNAITITLDQL